MVNLLDQKQEELNDPNTSRMSETPTTPSLSMSPVQDGPTHPKLDNRIRMSSTATRPSPLMSSGQLFGKTNVRLLACGLVPSEALYCRLQVRVTVPDVVNWPIKTRPCASGNAVACWFGNTNQLPPVIGFEFNAPPDSKTEKSMPAF